MTNAPQPPTDAESLVIEAKKLREVCLIAFPGRVGEMDTEYPWDFLVELGESHTHWYPDANCLDDLARILRELTPGQRAEFDGMMLARLCACPSDALTAPLPVLLDALYRAVCTK